MPLKVIGAGYPRTGTLSTKLALERLGFGPCHHMVEVFAHPESWPLWDRVADGLPVEWEDIFGGYQACTDAPSCFYWREIADRYPEAKVVLTVRDPESWHRSMLGTILTDRHRDQMLASDVGPILGKIAMRRMGGDGSVEGFPPPRETMIAAFEAHYAAVRAAIPKARLLETRPADGWEPLCRFLGVPVPDEPFPRVNSTEEFRGLEVPAS